jgi:hypothetical protein
MRGNQPGRVALLASITSATTLPARGAAQPARARLSPYGRRMANTHDDAPGWVCAIRCGSSRPPMVWRSPRMPKPPS